MKTPQTTARKSPALWLAMFGLWLAIALKYNPYLLELYDRVDTWPGYLMVSLVLLWINLVWFYGVFHGLTVVFSLLLCRIAGPRSGDAPSRSRGHVALLYTTCNDFKPEALDSCLNQAYDNFTVFVLDDSSSVSEQEKVASFCAQWPGKLVLVRRRDKSGYKAGNLNNALRTVASDSPYFAVADADEVLPPDFLARTVQEIESDERIAFVQVNHRYCAPAGSHFSRSMSQGVDLHWRLFLKARNSYGFVMCYGHGVLLRHDVWQRIGGFPEVVSEDIAYAARAREYGYHGVFLDDVVAEEEFPATYGSFLRREIKIFRGTFEFLLGPARTFFTSRNVSTVEKLDLMTSTGVLFLPILFVGFLIIANVALPVLIALQTAGAHLGRLGHWREFLEPLGAGIQSLWGWDFYLVTVLSILAPLVYQIPALLRAPLRVLHYAALSTAVHLSAVPALFSSFFGYVSGRRNPGLIPTGDQTTKNDRAIPSQTFALSLGIALAVAAVAISNFALLTVAGSFLLLPIFLRMRWQSPIVRVLAIVPFVFFLIVFGSIPFLLIGIAGALAAAVPAHH